MKSLEEVLYPFPKVSAKPFFSEFFDLLLSIPQNLTKMKEFTDKYIRALRNGGPILLAILVIHDEQKDDFVKSTSKITANPDLALRAILKSTLDMNLDIYESIIDGSFLRKHILPVPDIS